MNEAIHEVARSLSKLTAITIGSLMFAAAATPALVEMGLIS